MAPRNLRKKRKAESDEDDDDEEGQQTLQERIEDARTLIKSRAKSKVRRTRRADSSLIRSFDLAPSPPPWVPPSPPPHPAHAPPRPRRRLVSQGVGADALALGGGKNDASGADGAGAADPAAPGMGGFAQGVVADVDGEDPNMLKFIENELAKRRAGAGGGDASGDGGGDAAAAAKTDEERLWETPAELSTKKTEGAETADRWLTGIVEVQLPMDYKMRNIEETELAKQAMLERQRGGDGGDAEAAAARAALERQRSAAAPERREHQARPTSSHWFPYDRVGVVNADP